MTNGWNCSERTHQIYVAESACNKTIKNKIKANLGFSLDYTLYVQLNYLTPVSFIHHWGDCLCSHCEDQKDTMLFSKYFVSWMLLFHCFQDGENDFTIMFPMCVWKGGWVRSKGELLKTRTQLPSQFWWDGKYHLKIMYYLVNVLAMQTCRYNIKSKYCSSCR